MHFKTSTNLAIKKNILIFTLLCFYSYSSLSQEKQPRNLLTGSYSLDFVKSNLISKDKWHPYPNSLERAKWESIPAKLRETHIRIGEEAMAKKWPQLPATLFMEYKRNGIRKNHDSLREERRILLENMVIAECIEGKGRFVDPIVNAIWSISEESFWGGVAHADQQKADIKLPDVADPTVDLFAGETAGLLAWTDYLLGSQLDSVSPLVRERISLEVNRRVLTPFLEREDFWWMGFPTTKYPEREVNNWTTWISSNCLTSALMLEKDEQRRQKLVYKTLMVLDNFINFYQEDGGCDEGPSYWSHAGGDFFKNLDLLHNATNGSVNIYDKPIVRNIGQYIYKVYIDENYFVNFADAGMQFGIPALKMYPIGKRINDERMLAFAAYGAQQNDILAKGLNGNLGLVIPRLFDISELLSAKPQQPFALDFWLPNIQVLTARSQAGTSKGLYLAAQGGHNDESHNHNDVGNFIVYFNGKPAIIDMGKDTYNAKTFSPTLRYTLMPTQSAYHNLPTINGVMQKDGRQFAAKDVSYKSSASKVEFSLDIASAYPEEAGVTRWKRSIIFNRGKDIQLVENYELKRSTAPTTLSFMTPCEIDTTQAGKIALKIADSSSLYIYFDSNKLKPVIENIIFDEGRLKNSWGESVKRILLVANRPSLKDTWTIKISEK